MSLWYRPWFWGVVGGVLSAIFLMVMIAVRDASAIGVIFAGAFAFIMGFLGAYFGYGITQRRLAKSAETRDEGDRGQE